MPESNKTTTVSQRNDSPKVIIYDQFVKDVAYYVLLQNSVSLKVQCVICHV